MYVKKIIKAVRRWSPKGLCGGTLVVANGTPSKTEACSVGCLALEYLYSAKGAKYLRAREGGRMSRHDFTDFYLRNGMGIDDLDDGKFQKEVNKFFDLDTPTLKKIMNFNDRCAADNRPAPKTSLPPPLKNAIQELREQHEALRKAAENTD